MNQASGVVVLHFSRRMQSFVLPAVVLASVVVILALINAAIVRIDPQAALQFAQSSATAPGATVSLLCLLVATGITMTVGTFPSRWPSAPDAAATSGAPWATSPWSRPRSPSSARPCSGSST